MSQEDINGIPKEALEFKAPYTGGVAPEQKKETVPDLVDLVNVGDEPMARQPLSQEEQSNISKIFFKVRENNPNISPAILEDFAETDLLQAFPPEIRNNNEMLSQYMENSAKFDSLIYKERVKRWSEDKTGLLGEEVVIPESIHSNGRVRREEEGFKLNIDYLRTQGVDPSKVLYYRVTQPAETPKPEYYWTSDLGETLTGLGVEIPSEQRKSSIVLVADLETINQNGGLIQDINDDSGLAVRQIGLEPFDQKKCIGTMRHLANES